MSIIIVHLNTNIDCLKHALLPVSIAMMCLSLIIMIGILIGYLLVCVSVCSHA